jgi:hypothetical protein
MIKSRRTTQEGHVENKAVIKNGTIILVRKPRWRRPGHSWEDDIKMDLERESVEWICVAQNKNQWQGLVTMVMNLWDPYKTGALTSCVTINFSRTAGYMALLVDYAVTWVVIIIPDRHPDITGLLIYRLVLVTTLHHLLVLAPHPLFTMLSSLHYHIFKILMPWKQTSSISCHSA